MPPEVLSLHWVGSTSRMGYLEHLTLEGGKVEGTRTLAHLDYR